MQTGGIRLNDFTQNEGTGYFDSAVKVESSHHGFNAVGEECAVTAAPAAFFAASEQHVVAKFEPRGYEAQMVAADQFGTEAGKRTFAKVRVSMAQIFSDQEADDGVAEELQLLVIRAGVRAVVRGCFGLCGLGRFSLGKMLGRMLDRMLGRMVFMGQRTMRESALQQLGVSKAMAEQRFEFWHAR